MGLISRLLAPLTPDRPQVKRPPPLLQITSNFLVFYGLSHGITLKKRAWSKILRIQKSDKLFQVFLATIIGQILQK